MKILLVDDHNLFREGMRYVLQQLQGGIEIIEASNFVDALKQADLHPDLDLTLMDLNMPGSEGAVSVKFFHQRYPHIPLVIISGEEGRSLMEKVMSSGAMGFVCKSSTAPVMLSALNLVLAGGVYVPPQLLQHADGAPDGEPERRDKRSINTNEYGLTARQMQVLKHIAEGMSNKEIAREIALAEGTVKIHVAALYQTLRVNSRMEAVRVASQLGLIGAV
ncbi:MAG: response regulator transcription factor [Sideroxydans sp.]|nr:response regulator transcription factor [Sideroxydans sp.]